MKILFLDAYFYPENIAFSHLEKDLIDGLTTAGHQVEIISPIPTRAISDDIYESYKHCYNDNVYGANVRRFPLIRESRNPMARAIRYLLCNIREYVIATRYKNIDVVFSNSTPPTQGLLAGFVARKLHCPFIYSLQDVFPDSMVNSGMTRRGSFLWKIGRRIENKIYKDANMICVISDGIKRNIIEKGVNDKKILVVPNWIDDVEVKRVSKTNNVLYDELGVSRDKFTVLYAGNFGAMQGADIIIDVAKKLCLNQQIQFVVFGAGSEYTLAKSKANMLNLPNLHMFQLLPAERVSEVYSMGDVALITCKKGAGCASFPSKTWSIMACGTPIIASYDANSDLEHTISIARAGVCVEPENIDALVEAILAMRNGNNDEYENIRRYVIENASKSICVNQYVSIFQSIGKHM